MKAQTPRYGVSPSQYDDIGAVLDSLGEGFAYTLLSWNDLKKGRLPEACQVLFINCASEARSGLGAGSEAIRRFVERGGSLYASDWAGGLIEQAFPDVLSFEASGQSGHADCQVVDEGLREVIGSRIRVEFDLGGWWQIRKANADARTYVIWDTGWGQVSLPIVLGFPYGAGHVIYTSFHNKAQVSEAERKLLRFLVLRPALARAAASAVELGRARRFSPGKEIVTTVNRAERSGPYLYHAPAGQSLLFVLQWEGIGTLRLEVQDPSHQVVFRTEAARPPLYHEVPLASPGDWTCYVEAPGVPYDNFPFVLTVSSHPAIQSAISVKAKRRSSPPRQGPMTYVQSWSSLRPGCLIILLDQSSSMRDSFANGQLGAGKRKCDMVATVLNNLLFELVRTNTVGSVIKPRADIAVLAYEGSDVRSALGGPLANKPFVSLADLSTSPLRVETRLRKEVDENGNLLEVPVSFPVWVDPVIGTTTPMCAALRKAAELADEWAFHHPDHYPPVVINITDGASTDGDPTAAAHELCQIGTSDGAVLLFNCYLTDQPLPPLEFPSLPSQIPLDPENLGQTLFLMSSVIPEPARKHIAAATGRILPEGARGLILNGDAGSVRQLFVFATIAATRPLGPQS
jgi:hypothetical protein